MTTYSRKRPLPSSSTVSTTSQPLSSISSNLNTTTTSSKQEQQKSSSSRTTAPDTSRPVKKPRLTQLTLDLGQKVYMKCRICSMDYIVSSTEDRKLHKKFHDAFVEEQVRGITVAKGVLEKARVVRCVRTRRTREETSKERSNGAGKFFAVAGSSIPEAQKKEEEKDSIIEVRRTDNRSLRNLAERVLDVVENELGALRIEKKDLWSEWNAQTQDEEEDKGMKQTAPSLKDRYRVYLYIHDAHCIGLLLAERITEGRKVLPCTHPQDVPASPEGNSSNPFFRTKKRLPQALPPPPPLEYHLPTPPPSSPMMMLDDGIKDENTDNNNDDSSNINLPPKPLQTNTRQPTTPFPPPPPPPQTPLMASTTPTPAALGISRIWILSSFRASGVAHSLLDTARTSFGRCGESGGSGVDEEDAMEYAKIVVAFSQPTEMGRRFAERWWGGGDGWLVYD